MGIIGTFEGFVTSPLYILNSGEWSNIQTTGFTATVGSVGYSSRDKQYNLTGIARTNQTINMSNYNYLKGNLYGGRYGGRDYNIILGISQSPNLTSNNFNASYTGHTGTFIVNISNIYGNYFIYASILNVGTELGIPSIKTLFLTTT